MKNLWLNVALPLFLTTTLSAQELTLLGGGMTTTDFDHSSVSWQIDYRQNLTEHLAASIALINEGHIPNHHRDGTALELWGRLPFNSGRNSVSLGLGAYYFYDTQNAGLTGSNDVHAVAPIASLSYTGTFSKRWFYRAMFNHIHPSNDVKVNTAALGVGFWFGQDDKPTPGKLGDAPGDADFVTDNEFTVFAGQSIVNTLFSENARAFGLEFRRGLDRHLDWTASYIHEGDPKIIRRSGLAGQIWAVNSFFEQHISVGIGVGPYFYIDRRHPAIGANGTGHAAIAPIVGLTFATRLSERWVARIIWDRVTSNYDRDSDVFLLGLGVRWR
jgi:hypothetical protein